MAPVKQTRSSSLTWVGQARRLDEDGVEPGALALHEGGQDADEVAPNGAADATVVHLDDVFLPEGLAVHDGVVHPDLVGGAGRWRDGSG